MCRLVSIAGFDDVIEDRQLGRVIFLHKIIIRMLFRDSAMDMRLFYKPSSVHGHDEGFQVHHLLSQRCAHNSVYARVIHQPG